MILVFAYNNNNNINNNIIIIVCRGKQSVYTYTHGLKSSDITRFAKENTEAEASSFTMASGGVTVKDVPAKDFIRALAAHFKSSGKIELPPWASVVKTAKHKQLAPYDPDWYYVRAASIARKIYLRPGTGVGALRIVYGGRYRRGAVREHFSEAAGKIIRHILQALAQLDIVAVQEDKKGRYITKSGQHELDTVAAQVVVKKTYDF